MGEPCQPSKKDREETRRLATAIVESVRNDERMPAIQIHDTIAGRFYSSNDVNAVVLQLAQEICALQEERDDALTACRETVKRANAIHDRHHEHTQRGQSDPRLLDDTHDLLHFCIGSSRDGESFGPRAAIGRKP